MELCYHSYAILLGANQLFAAKQHRSDRSNGRQDYPQDITLAFYTVSV